MDTSGQLQAALLAASNVLDVSLLCSDAGLPCGNVYLNLSNVDALCKHTTWTRELTTALKVWATSPCRDPQTCHYICMRMVPYFGAHVLHVWARTTAVMTARMPLSVHEQLMDAEAALNTRMQLVEVDVFIKWLQKSMALAALAKADMAAAQKEHMELRAYFKRLEMSLAVAAATYAFAGHLIAATGCQRLVPDEWAGTHRDVSVLLATRQFFSASSVAAMLTVTLCGEDSPFESRVYEACGCVVTGIGFGPDSAARVWRCVKHIVKELRVTEYEACRDLLLFILWTLAGTVFPQSRGCHECVRQHMDKDAGLYRKELYGNETVVAESAAELPVTSSSSAMVDVPAPPPPAPPESPNGSSPSRSRSCSRAGSALGSVRSTTPVGGEDMPCGDVSALPTMLPMPFSKTGFLAAAATGPHHQVVRCCGDLP